MPPRWAALRLRIALLEWVSVHLAADIVSLRAWPAMWIALTLHVCQARKSVMRQRSFSHHGHASAWLNFVLWHFAPNAAAVAAPTAA